MSTMCQMSCFGYEQRNRKSIIRRRLKTVMGCSHDPANVQQTSGKCIQNTRANAGRLLNRVNTLLVIVQ